MPGWYLEFKFFIHNKGRLAIQSHDHNVYWVMGPGPLVDVPFLDIPWEDDFPGEESYPAPLGFEYTEQLLLHDPTEPCDAKPCLNPAHYTIEYAPTTYSLKPCECVLVKEKINANIQDYPEYQCHWFRLTKELIFSHKVPQLYSSFGYELPPTP
jgi:hypothetical protein